MFDVDCDFIVMNCFRISEVDRTSCRVDCDCVIMNVLMNWFRITVFVADCDCVIMNV